MALSSQFEKIQESIYAGKIDAARSMLKSLLQKTPADPNAWWLYAQVAENERQQYFILDELLKLPANQYTSQARALLSRLHYQHPKANPLLVHAPTDKNVSNLALGLAVGAAIIIVMIGLFTFISGNRPMLASAMPLNESALAGQVLTQPQVQPTQERIIVTLVPRSTKTPIPTNTPLPTRTLRPTQTSQPKQPTATATLPPDMTEVVPTLYQNFSDRVTALTQVAVDTSNMLKDPTSVSLDTLDTITKQMDEMRQVRNQVMLVNLRAVPVAVRREVILPAHNALINYANGYLKLLDTQIVAVKLYNAAMQPDVKDFKAAFKLYKGQVDVVTKQATMVDQQSDALHTTLLRFEIYATTEQVRGEVSGQAKVLSGTSKGYSVTLKAGTYAMFSRSSNGFSVTLTSVNDKNRTFEISKDSKVFNVPSGTYDIKVSATEWWILAIDPT